MLGWSGLQRGAVSSSFHYHYSRLIEILYAGERIQQLLIDTGKRQEMSVKKNDRVLFSSYAGSEIKMDGDEMLILGEDEILAVIE